MRSSLFVLSCGIEVRLLCTPFILLFMAFGARERAFFGFGSAARA